jgi:hypothetical protein
MHAPAQQHCQLPGPLVQLSTHTLQVTAAGHQQRGVLKRVCVWTTGPRGDLQRGVARRRDYSNEDAGSWPHGQCFLLAVLQSHAPPCSVAHAVDSVVDAAQQPPSEGIGWGHRMHTWQLVLAAGAGIAASSDDDGWTGAGAAFAAVDGSAAAAAGGVSAARFAVLGWGPCFMGASTTTS